MKWWIVLVCFLGFAQITSAQSDSRLETELSLGSSMLIYQSIYSLQSNVGVEVAVKRRMNDSFAWQGGVRVGTENAHSELFFRFLVAQNVRAWRPSAGLEIGWTNRAQFGPGEKLLRETRLAMQKDISPIYFAGYSAPLSFRIFDTWNISLCEIQYGTHFDHIGRTVRFQFGFFNMSKIF